ncbi:MAG: HDIG domain-containing protein [Clostridia bacterium]|nr:HDIG domain-containing protein [Clostridia bacterium]
MSKKTRKAGAARLAPVLQNTLVIAATYLLLAAMLLIGITPEQHDIQIGAPASMDILATKDVNDVVTTEEHREAAAAMVEPSYRSIDFSVVGTVSANMDAAFNQLFDLRSEEATDLVSVTDDQLATLNQSLPVELSLEEYVALMRSDEDNVRHLFNDAILNMRDVLNSTLPEGQEIAAVNRLSRSLAATGYSQPLVSLATKVIAANIQPNMLIDEEITEANRQKARDAVEMETCVKGEVIVRRGEIVTQAQYTMLSSLGLLKEDSMDVPLLAGIALLVLLVMAAVGVYLRRYLPDRLTTKNVMLLCLIAVVVVGLCLAISRWNAYAMPVSLGVMLVALLFEHRSALFINIAMGILASLLLDASSGLFAVSMFSIVLMSLLSGPIVLAVYSHRMQRISSLLAGMLVGLSNFLCTLAVGLINSAELRGVMTNALWAMTGGIVSAILCIGLQPVLEALFNIATNSKLIELSNPNQPLLRRLLLEAPGTYHHSIIVANLAEAAASAVGANALLARVGAYYHDIGKLKRPVYFKENQMGDNPHDRTDPRVSAAILTAHPRDGVAMAQKARIPAPVLDIIRQHHGDGITIYFFDKATKLYGAENVDVNAFRYEGPRPRTKEAAAVMLADTIEAAARAIPDPTPEKIDALIHKLVRDKLNDGQLDESDLTFSDLEKICGAFSTVLTGVFHERIEYPDVSIPPRMEQAASAPAAEPTDSAGPQAEAGAGTSSVKEAKDDD